jgi:hypothetical protein
MIRPSNRSLVILITLIGFAGVFAIGYSGAGADSQFAYAMRILLATLTAFVVGAAIVRRDPSGLLIGAGLAAWSFDTFSPHLFLAFGGTLLFVGGFLLMARNYRSTLEHKTGV